MSSRDGTLLRIEGLRADYGDAPVLRDVALSVDAGTIVALIGANGAGKTTLLRAISGILRPAAGRIEYDGRDLSRRAPEDIVEAGLVHVPEGRRLFPSLTVEENLLVGASAPRSRARQAEGLARVFDTFPRVRERRAQLAATLSGGEQQMVAIGRGLMANPRLLLLDEPSLGLSPLVVDEIFRVIGELHGQGLTVLLVEQNTALALEVASRAYVLEQGAVVLAGESGALAADDRVRRAYLGV